MVGLQECHSVMSFIPDQQKGWVILGVAMCSPSSPCAPSQVTQALFPAIAAGQAASAVVCAVNDCELELVDVGVDADISSVSSSNAQVHVHHQKVSCALVVPWLCLGW